MGWPASYETLLVLSEIRQMHHEDSFLRERLIELADTRPWRPSRRATRDDREWRPTTIYRPPRRRRQAL